MEIQIHPYHLHDAFSWAAGIFGTQCILALQKRGGAVQLPALICSAVVLVVGGIAVVFHLTHPFNLFNGFGHITSGITQELIAIVLLAVVMVLFFLMLRRSEDDTVPQWLAVVGLVVVRAHRGHGPQLHDAVAARLGHGAAAAIASGRCLRHGPGHRGLHRRRAWH